ncbi:MAG: hypothetical protein H6807_07700 [Planctomycetes bacterium]|nr:hypothetical protein [Planctomycetota bacterium]
MSEARSKADQLMRKASEAFAKGKFQKAHRAYGDALKAYAGDDTAPRERIALALYTRAMLVLSGDATGQVQVDLDAGDRLCAGEVEFPGRARFAGLFLFARAFWKRQNDLQDEAQGLLDRAREILGDQGRPHDLFELEREQVRLATEARDLERAEAAAIRAADQAQGPKMIIMGRLLVAGVLEARGHWSEMLQVLDRAASYAFDHELKDELWDLQDRIDILKRNHPEVVGT